MLCRGWFCLKSLGTSQHVCTVFLFRHTGYALFFIFFPFLSVQTSLAAGVISSRGRRKAPLKESDSLAWRASSPMKSEHPSTNLSDKENCWSGHGRKQIDDANAQLGGCRDSQKKRRKSVESADLDEGHIRAGRHGNDASTAKDAKDVLNKEFVDANSIASVSESSAGKHERFCTVCLK